MLNSDDLIKFISICRPYIPTVMTFEGNVYLATHSTHMIKDHTDNDRRSQLPPLHVPITRCHYTK